MALTPKIAVLGYQKISTPTGKTAGRLPFFKTDVGILIRSKEFSDRYRLMLNRLSSCNIRPDGTGEDPRSEGILAEAEKKFEVMIDEVVGLSGASAECFSRYRPFAIMKGGVFYAACVMDALFKAGETVGYNVRQIITK